MANIYGVVCNAIVVFTDSKQHVAHFHLGCPENTCKAYYLLQCWLPITGLGTLVYQSGSHQADGLMEDVPGIAKIWHKQDNHQATLS